MADNSKRNGLVVPAGVIAFCGAFLVLMIVLASRNDSSGDSAPLGFALTFLALAVLGTVLALVWRSVSRRRRG